MHGAKERARALLTLSKESALPSGALPHYRQHTQGSSDSSSNGGNSGSNTGNRSVGRSSASGASGSSGGATAVRMLDLVGLGD